MAAERKASRRPLLWIALLCITPFAASVALYFWWQPSAQINYGTLLSPQPLSTVGLRAPNGDPLPALRGKWILLTIDPIACGEACAKKLYATRQARTMQGKDRERIVRVWVATGDGAPPADLVAAHPDLVIARSDQAFVAALPAPPESAVFAIDPLGNLILRYPADPDIKKLNRDLARLLYTSQIG